MEAFQHFTKQPHGCLSEEAKWPLQVKYCCT